MGEIAQQVAVSDAGQGVQRHPHVDIAGKMKVLGDVMSSAPETDWDLPAYGGNAGN